MLSDFRQKKVKKIFSFYDANNNGVLDMGDIDGICDHFAKEFNWTRGSEPDMLFRSTFTTHWRILMHLADANADGVVTQQEFLNHYEKAIGDDRGFYKYIKPFFDDIFPVIDSDNDGMLSKQDYMALFRSFRNSPAEAEYAFQKMDLNGDGEISHYELYTMFYNYHMTDDRNHASNFFYGHM